MNAAEFSEGNTMTLQEQFKYICKNCKAGTPYFVTLIS